VETIAAAFTDHLAVVLRLAVEKTDTFGRKRLLENERIVPP
jgi:hypothetical protein